MDISYWLCFLLMVLYARFIAGSECWGGWSRETFHNLWTFTRLALLGTLHVATEWWSMEIVALVAGHLGSIPLASQSAISTVDQILCTIPFGVGVATSSRVGNLLGERDVKAASRATHLAAFLGAAIGGLICAVLMITRNHFAKMFNSDPRVIELTAEVIPFVALFQVADGINCSYGGAMRSMGRQHLGAVLNVISFYGLGLPVGIHLAFHGWGLRGLWLGQCAGLWLSALLEMLFVAFTRWDNEVRKAFKRIDSHSEDKGESRSKPRSLGQV
ncbi:MATE efflux family protein [Penicillium capsulatum]|uniref:MATE efflux family protein n=1 Tax=Penicillium capsulatum TaxID=69766 RepID=A0A9W9LZP8_9EURO|nr:MATE efflux family protein [Penicillium capsulatum]KAJ6129716.1 MATE efflux family protein [Penicillium capsulatum]